MENTNEIWKPVPVPGFEKYYEISDKGRIRSLPRQTIVYREDLGREYIQNRSMKIIKVTDKPHSQLLSTKLSYKDPETNKTKNVSIYVHKLVAQAFIKNPDVKKYTKVAHIDNNPKNNLPNNLKWVESNYFAKKKVLLYTDDVIPKKRGGILDPKTIQTIKDNPKVSATYLANKLGVSIHSIYKYRKK